MAEKWRLLQARKKPKTEESDNHFIEAAPWYRYGTFPPESINRRRKIGAWMKINGEAIYARMIMELSGRETL